MEIIGITGGIGSGKTAVSKYLESKGYVVIDADLLARDLVRPGSGGLGALVECFGESILTPDGGLDRRALADIVFSDERRRLDMEAILHGRISDMIGALLEKNRSEGVRLLFLCAPLLIETGLHGETGSVWLIEAGESERIRRVRARDGVSDKAVRERMSAQLPFEEKKKFADVIIDNSGDLEGLYKQVDALLCSLANAGD